MRESGSNDDTEAILKLVGLAILPRCLRCLSPSWPFLVGSTLIASAMLWRGAVTRFAGAILFGLGLLYAGLHLVIR
jgi:hypothetical protein